MRTGGFPQSGSRPSSRGPSRRRRDPSRGPTLPDPGRRARSVELLGRREWREREELDPAAWRVAQREPLAGLSKLQSGRRARDQGRGSEGPSQTLGASGKSVPARSSDPVDSASTCPEPDTSLTRWTRPGSEPPPARENATNTPGRRLRLPRVCGRARSRGGLVGATAG